HMRLGRAAFEKHDFDDPQRDNYKDAGKQYTGKEQPGAAGLERLPRRTLGNDGRAGRRLEVPRAARIVVITMMGLSCDHHRLVMIWAIKSSSDLARRGAGLDFATAFTGAGLPGCGPAAGFSNRAGITRSALCVAGGSATVSGVAGSGASTGTPSGALGGALVAVGASAAGSAAAMTAAASAGGGGGAGGGGRSGMSAAVA